MADNYAPIKHTADLIHAEIIAQDEDGDRVRGQIMNDTKGRSDGKWITTPYFKNGYTLRDSQLWVFAGDSIYRVL